MSGNNRSNAWARNPVPVNWNTAQKARGTYVNPDKLSVGDKLTYGGQVYTFVSTMYTTNMLEETVKAKRVGALANAPFTIIPVRNITLVEKAAGGRSRKSSTRKSSKTRRTRR